MKGWLYGTSLASVVQSVLEWTALQVQPFLQHARWETRAAASECIGLMAQQAQHPAAAQLQEAALHASTAAGNYHTALPAVYGFAQAESRCTGRERGIVERTWHFSLCAADLQAGVTDTDRRTTCMADLMCLGEISG